MRTDFNIAAQVKPFKMRFVTDADEISGSTASSKASMSEVSVIPGGIIGFYLNWNLVSC